MKRVFWCALAFACWNLVFDYQVRRAGDIFVAEQLVRYQRREAVVTINDGFRPQVRQAAVVASAITAGAVLIGVVVARRRTRGRPTSTTAGS